MMASGSNIVRIRTMAMLCIGLAAACTRTEPPAPVVQMEVGQSRTVSMPAPAPVSAPAEPSSRPSWQSAPVPSASPAASAPDMAVPAVSGGGTPDSVVVQRGDTLYALSRRYNIPVRDLIEANDIRPPYYLLAGQRIVLPSPRIHVVRPGDTLYGVSRQFGVDSTEVVRLNRLNEPYRIQVGQVLRLPSESPVPASGPASDPAPESAPIPASTAVASAPPPATASSPSGPVPVRKPSASSPDAAAPQAPHAAPPQATPSQIAPPPTVVAATPPAAPAQPAPVDSPPPRGGSRFLWPVSGPILSEFGPKPGGLHNDGVNIAAAAGTPVLAADNGVVAYAGNELRGFGNLLLIRHADGWMTAYAHLDRMLVQRGEQVRRGQSIGTIGTTGSVTVPQLHFEIRRGSRAVNPNEHLDPSQRVTAAETDETTG